MSDEGNATDYILTQHSNKNARIVGKDVRMLKTFFVTALENLHATTLKDFFTNIL